jgi:hypothetical protein
MYFGNKWSTQQLVSEAKKQNVKYYFYFYEGTNNDYVLTDEHGKAFTEVAPGKISGVKVFQLQ